MPLEIRELIIRTQITSQEKQQEEHKGSTPANVDLKELVNLCINQLMHLLEKEKER